VAFLFAKTLANLSSNGAEIISIDIPAFHPIQLSQAEVALFEFKESINNYLNTPDHVTCPTVTDILASSDVDSIAVGPTWQLAKLPSMNTASPKYHARLHRIEQLKITLANVFAGYQLDALIHPHQTVLVVSVGATFQPGRNGLLTSLTGTPGAVVPIGFSAVTEEATLGIPVGMEVVGLWGDDRKVLEISAAVERLLQARQPPELMETTRV
jgi:Asp-tRNA(Asn)/Glu-tRNA(Gln) amidotransferase A subunit family amidase